MERTLSVRTLGLRGLWVRVAQFRTLGENIKYDNIQ